MDGWWKGRNEMKPIERKIKDMTWNGIEQKNFLVNWFLNSQANLKRLKVDLSFNSTDSKVARIQFTIINNKLYSH